MNEWTNVLNRIWYYLEEGPNSTAVTEKFPKANRYRYDASCPEPAVPDNVNDPVLIVDQTGGNIELDYSPAYLKVSEEYQITIWSGGIELERINDLRYRVLKAIHSGLPDLGLDNVLDVRVRTGRVTLALDKIERDADGRLMQWRRDLHRVRQRAVLLELMVTFLIDRDDLE